MSKGYVSEVLGLYRGILQDVAVYLPTYQLGCERDYNRLASLFEDRGLGLFTLDLPNLGKLLESSLRSGYLPKTGLPLTKPINRRTMIPRLFQGLWCRVFDDTGCLRIDIDPTVVFLLRSLCYALKKYDKECPPSATFAEIKEYFDVEANVPPPSPYWVEGRDSGMFGSLADHLATIRRHSLTDVCSRSLFGGATDTDREAIDTIQRLADRVAGSLGEFLPGDSAFRHGPGAVADVPDMGMKYSFPSWPSTISDVFDEDEFAFANLSIAMDDPGGRSRNRYRGAVPAVLIAVPKTQKAPRLIAKESTANQWCQQAVRSFLYDRVRATPLGLSIDFRRQDLSRDLALSASLTGSLCTMDLKSASDRITCWLVERLFRGNISLLEAFRSVRTQYVFNHTDKKQPKLHKLRKFSTQGSALTFPVQSIVFFMIVVGVGCWLTKTNIKDYAKIARQVRIFGDDLIFPKDWEPFVRQYLEGFWLRVNQTKTHAKGNFRESCGMDAWHGVDVTPAYVRGWYEESKPASLRRLVDVHNNFMKKGLWHAAQFLASTVPWRIRKDIPLVGPRSGAFGFLSFSGSMIPPGVKTRWNHEYQRAEARLIVSVDATKKGRRYEGCENLLQFFTEDRPSHWWDIPNGETSTGITGSRAVTKICHRWAPISDYAS